MKKKILVIDDEQDIITILTQRLSASGYQVSTATDGAQGLKKVESEKPDLIILDVIMPVMDGFQFFKLLKKDPAKTRIPVLVLTARGAMRDTFEAFDADEFMAKPFDAGELILRVDRMFKNMALICCSDTALLDKLKFVFQKYNFDVDVAKNESEIQNKVREVKYKFITRHITGENQDPRAVISQLRMYKNKAAKIIAYVDKESPLTRLKSREVLFALKNKWEEEGFALFFDAQNSDKTFSEHIKELSN